MSLSRRPDLRMLPNWPAIERHPRLVVDDMDDLWVSVILRLLDAGRPFTVVRP